VLRNVSWTTSLHRCYQEREDLERLMRLGIASLGGTLAATGLLVQSRVAFPTLLAIPLAFGIAMQAVATALASRTRSPVEASIGPSIGDVFAHMATPASLKDLRMALLDQATMAERHNEQVLEEATGRRSRSGTLLFTGAGTVFLALAFVVGGAILG